MDVPEFWKEALKERTPDAHKVELSGERFVAGTHRATQRWTKGRKNKPLVKVDEPLMKMIDEVMTKEGVSDRRLENAMGLHKRKLKSMRQTDGTWKVLKLARQMLWAMGYDLEIKVVKKANPDKVLVVTNSEIEMKNIRRINMFAEDWRKQDMWSFLGMEKLEKRD